jgi:uncharacterized membrane protein YgcG
MQSSLAPSFLLISHSDFFRTPLSRTYEGEIRSLDRQGVENHPLLPRKAPIIAIKTKETRNVKRNSTKSLAVSDPLGGGGDPLGATASSDPLSDPLSAMAVSDDPLSRMMNADTSPRSNNNSSAADHSKQVLEENRVNRLNTPWSTMKQQIARDYTVVGNITVGASSIREFTGSGVEDGSSSRKIDRYTKRLAGLEKRDYTEDKIELSQKEYAAHVQKLESDLHVAWANDERVLSLKIAIQLAKLLADANMPLFYPSIFVMVTDVLECFGDMVYNRLKKKAEDSLPPNSSGRPSRLPENFTAADVPTVAKETCRNWFYKTACIRELLPRIYVETALLKCFRFLADGENAQILARLGSIIRGVGDPLISLYARAYLVVVGTELAPHASQYTIGMVYDVLTSFSMIDSPHQINELKRLGITRAQYLHTMSPGVQWLMKSVGKVASKETFQSILHVYRDNCNDCMVLKHIIDAFDPAHYSHAAIGMSTLIRSTTTSCVTTIDLYTALGRQFIIAPPPDDQRLQLLNDVWKVVSKSEDLGSYLQCSAAWLEVIYRHYTERETLILLTDLTLKLQQQSCNDYREVDLRSLESLFKGLLSQASSPDSTLLTTDHLLKILDCFIGMKRVELCKDVMDSFRNHHISTTNDAVLIHTMLDIGRTLHNSLDSLSDDSEKRHISYLLCSFINQIDFGKDLEQQLNIYVECRSIFPNLDLVQDKLIMGVCSLAIKAYRYMRGRHTKKTSAFSKACLAFCHITIPSIADMSRKLLLQLYCAQIALLNQNLPQTDTFLKSFISLIPEMSSEGGAAGGAGGGGGGDGGTSGGTSSGGGTSGSVGTSVSVSASVENKRIYNEEKLYLMIKSLLSTLVIAPGHPEHGPFYLIQGLLNALTRFSWGTSSSSTQFQLKIYYDIVSLLCTLSQRSFPYRIQFIESNDKLYGGTVEYLQELNDLLMTVIQEILKLLSGFNPHPPSTATASATASSSTTGGSPGAGPGSTDSGSGGSSGGNNLMKLMQYKLIVEFIDLISCRMVISPEVAQFVVKLLELSLRNKQILSRTDLKYLVSVLENLKRRLEGSSGANVLSPVIRNLLAEYGGKK